MTSTATPAWRAETDADGIAWLSFDKPGTSTNVLSSDDAGGVRYASRGAREIAAARPGDPLGEGLGFHRRRRRARIRAARERRAGRSNWCAPRSGIFDRLEALPCPTVAIIHGFALGGGFELALACRYRVGVRSDKFSIGLPEVMLGIHPGFGGTVRAVRRAGVRTAMEMMLTGKTLRADKAKQRRLHRPAGLSRRCRGRGARADQPPAEAAPAAAARSRVVLAAGALAGQEAAHRPGARQGAPGALSGSLRHHRPVDEARRARRSARTRPKRAPSPSSWSERPRATWCACSRCRSGSRTWAARASCRSSAYTWSARA